MYKVFVNNKPLIFIQHVSHEQIVEGDHVVHRSKINDIFSFIKEFEGDQIIKRIFLVDENVDAMWQEFKNYYKQIYAAGGIVKNKHNELLYIFRTGRWDLPKGKVEGLEHIEQTAIREVEEECGISKLNITNHLPATYHTYETRESDVLKTTYWFEMYCDDESEPVPQTEEGIEKVCWLPASSLPDVFKNTFSSIEDLLREYYKL
jgi:8-oxo-dGTP pyrophosphatase MutT (NUDIX family)